MRQEVLLWLLLNSLTLTTDFPLRSVSKITIHSYLLLIRSARILPLFPRRSGLTLFLNNQVLTVVLSMIAPIAKIAVLSVCVILVLPPIRVCVPAVFAANVQLIVFYTLNRFAPSF